MGVEPKKTNKPIAKLLHAAGLDLDAATRLLAEPPNELAANHLQQAAEKILAAVTPVTSKAALEHAAGLAAHLETGAGPRSSPLNPAAGPVQ